jgi:hypothetical protein
MFIDQNLRKYFSMTLIDLGNEFINFFLFVDGSIHPKKKMMGNCIIARSA